MTLPAFSIARPIARGIAHPIAAHEGVGVSPPFGVYNWNPTYLAASKAALAAVRANTADMRILCIGDSTTWGLDGLDTGSNVGAYAGSYGRKLAQLLWDGGINAVQQDSWGDAGHGANQATYDTRVVLNSWAINAVSSFGGQTWRAAAAAGNLAYTPDEDTDTCEVYFLTNPGLGAGNGNVNGGSNTAIASNATQGYGKITLSGALGANTYNVTWASGGAVHIAGFAAWNSAAKRVRIFNVGRGGATAGNLAGVWTSVQANIAVIAPHLTIIEVGINDWLTAVATGTFSTNLQSLIDGAQAAGSDVLLVSAIKSNPVSSGIADATQQTYLDFYPTKAVADNAVLLDINTRWGGFTAANAAGYMSADGVHASLAGYLDQATALKQILLAA